MPSNFSSLRNSRKNLLTKLSEEVKKASGPQQGDDSRFWKLSVDQKSGIGFAKLRFLPAPKEEEIPWVRVWSHGFKGGSGSWFIENCPTTLGGKKCPVCKENNRLWNSGVDSDKDIARNRKRKLSFISNILVLEDKAHPENVGKVFLYRYGIKIHEKIMELIEPQFPDQQPANPFDLWEGCDFILKAQKKDGFQNYDKSSFSEPVELFPGDDDQKEVIWSSEFTLLPFVAEDKFKSFEELDTRLSSVLTGEQNAARTAEAAAKEEDTTTEDEKPAPAPVKQTAPKATKPAAAKKTAPAPVAKVEEPAADSDMNEDDVKSFFDEVLQD